MVDFNTAIELIRRNGGFKPELMTQIMSIHGHSWFREAYRYNSNGH